MPRVKIDYVVSFSSEDPEHPASNLMALEVSRRRWLCARGESPSSVVLQLAGSVQISAVHVGAHHAALVEVLVGRSETHGDDYKVLVPSCIFLSPMESRRGEGVERVRSFSGDQLVADVRDEKWDRVRVVCSQPYNKHCKYGLSFIHVFEPESGEPPAPPAPALPAALPSRLFQLDTRSSDEEDSFSPGELFRKHLTKERERGDGGGGASTDAQIRQANSQALKNISQTSTKLVKTPIAKEKPRSKRSPEREGDTNRERRQILYDDEDAGPHNKIDHVIQRHRDEKNKCEDTSKLQDKPDKERRKKEHTNKNSSNDHTKKDNSKLDFSWSKDVNNTDRRTEPNNRPRSSDHKNKDKLDNSRSEDKTGRAATSRDQDKQSASRDGRDSRKRRHSDDRKSSMGEHHTAQARLRAGPVSDAPHSLLSDVVFVLSGYQNPQRATIREQALALGARVERDWSERCTHLICAFPNTPKLREVRGGARGARAAVVTGEWVAQCARRRRRLPWQWFATEPARRRPEEHGDDGEDDAMQPSRENDECDTDDEIEKVLKKQKPAASRTSSTRAADTSAAGSSETTDTSRTAAASETADTNRNAAARETADTSKDFLVDERVKGSVTVGDSGDDTDAEEQHSIAEEIAPDATLPDFLDGATFVIDASVKEAGFDAARLQRYVSAYGGEVLDASHIDDDTEVSYVLSAGAASETANHASLSRSLVLRADWLWRCHEARALCATDQYLIS